MKGKEIFKEVTLTNGDKMTIYRATGGDLMLANFNYIKNGSEEQKDFSAFLMQKICYFNGKQITFKQLEDLYIEDFLMISEIIALLLTPMKNYF